MQILHSIAVLFSLAVTTAAGSAGGHRHKEGSAGGHHHKEHKGHKGHKGHHHHHHKGHHHHAKHRNVPVTVGVAPNASTMDRSAANVSAAVPKPAPVNVMAIASAHQTGRDEKLVAEMKALEMRLAKKKKTQEATMEKGHLYVNGPLPADFSNVFAHAVAHATGVEAKRVKVTRSTPVKDQPGVVAVDFEAPPKTVTAVEDQSSDPDSQLAAGSLHAFLVAKSGAAETESEEEDPKPSSEATPVETKGIDIDTAMPYGDLEPFGREDTAQELTEDSIKESDEMVDQLERAEVSEEKRAVFRALTRLRGAAITSFDGVARSQTGNIDEYNKIHQWRKTHPLHHLADEESDVSKWAFPDNADF